MRTDVVVIGAGQAGLATSLALAGVNHVLLERTGVGARWRERGRDALTLITPRHLSALPGHPLPGDPDGYATRGELADHLARWADRLAAPVVTGTEVLAVVPDGDGFVLRTTAGEWRARAVVLATGQCARAAVPDVARRLHPSLHQVTADAYRHPGALPDGGVLVVGAGASGVQVADELAAVGRDVVLAVGRHTRLPRRYRGRDTLAWLADLGALDRPRASLPDPVRPPHEPSMQLVGAARDVDLRTLQDRGVALAGRLVGADDARARFAPDLTLACRHADEHTRAVLRRIDVLADAGAAPTDEAARAVLPARTVDAEAEVDLLARGVRSVVWATGYRRADPVLPPGVGALGVEHTTGARTAVPGLFVVGVPWQTRRSSALLAGVGDDARLVAAAVRAWLGDRVPAGARTPVPAA